MYIPRADWLEVIEHATGLGRSDDGEVAAADKLLQWIRVGSLDPADVFRAIVTGSAHADVALNARVLSVVSWLCVVGGPEVLPAAVYVTSSRKPSPGLRICFDVLKSLGYTNDPEDALYDDNKVREMRIQSPGEPSADHSSTLKGGRRLSVSDAMLVAAVEAYAIALGRKLIFHHRYPEVEANYSLDRYFRKMRIENSVDYERESVNLERHGQLFSKVTAAEMALIVHSSVVAADRLQRAGAPADLCILAVAEACNAFSFAEYLLMKVTAPRVGDFNMEKARSGLVEKLERIHSRRGPELRILKRFVDPRVMATIMDRKVRPSRPESKHRREIMCTFSSFEAMHRAFTPNLGRHSSQQK